jgi:IPT/TIG domain
MRHISSLLPTLLATLVLAGCGSAAHTDPFKSSAAFTPPAITALTPNASPVNSVPFFMTVTGTNFGSDAVVFWHGVPQFTRVVSPTQLLVNVTDTDLSYFGLAPIYVRTQGLNSNTVDFDVTIQ